MIIFHDQNNVYFDVRKALAKCVCHLKSVLPNSKRNRAVLASKKTSCSCQPEKQSGVDMTKLAYSRMIEYKGPGIFNFPPRTSRHRPTHPPSTKLVRISHIRLLFSNN